jgi:CheY-like chemotaxis protein
MVSGAGWTETQDPRVSQWADTTRRAAGLGSSAFPREARLRVKGLSSTAFIGDPWPMKSTGVFPVILSIFMVFPTSSHAFALSPQAMYTSCMPYTKTILLADDDESIRKLVKMVLEAQKFTVLTADSGEAALAVSEAHAGPIHLLLTDIVMAKITGKELADLICKVRTEMRVMFMSGYPRDTLFENGVCHEKLFFLKKPFSMPIMIGMVHEVLGMSAADLKNAVHE